MSNAMYRETRFSASSNTERGIVTPRAVIRRAVEAAGLKFKVKIPGA